MKPTRAVIRIAGLLAALAPAAAWAGVEAWRVNEVSVSSGGDPELRFVELYAPPSMLADNCFFSSTRLEVLDADGALVGSVAPFGSTTCFAGDTYFLFATTAAAAHHGVPRDASLPYSLSGSAGQVCLRSSATRYDCVRWGAVSTPIPDFGDPSDTTSAPTIPDDSSLSRIATTDVVATDFAVQSPTPRQPNDGTTWYPPDAGPPPDANLTPDATIPDAWVTPDARPRPDAPPPTDPPAWLSADPGGSACTIGDGSQSFSSSRALGVAILLIISLLFRRR